MNEEFDQQWRETFSTCVAASVGDTFLGSLLDSDDEELSTAAWTRKAVTALEDRLGVEKAGLLLSDCACQYPTESLQLARQSYELTGSVDAAMEVLQEQFEIMLEKVLELDQELILEIKERNMGSAGRQTGNRIIATKIPKSGNLKVWFKEQDPVKKAQLYCHCPRVADVAATEAAVPESYCYCGAGFYKQIWEEILQRPVRVEVLESVQSGAETCKISILLPPEML